MLQIFRNLQWKLVVIFTLLILIAIQLIGVYFISSLENFYTNDLITDLRAQATLLGDNASPVLLENIPTDKTREELDLRLKRLVYLKTKGNGTVEAEILDEMGYVLSSSSEKSKNIEKKNLLAQKFTNKLESHFTRVDTSTGHYNLVFIKQLTNNNGQRIGTVYIEASLESIFKKIKGISKILIQSTALALAATGILIFLLSRTITTPLKEITVQATAMAAGDFNRQVAVKSEDEIGKLASSFNYLAAHLRRALSQNEEEREKLETVLANMSDGVLATDHHGHIIVKNRLVEEMLGRPIQLGDKLIDVLPMEHDIQFPLQQVQEEFIELHPHDPATFMMLKVSYIPIKQHKKERLGLIAVLSNVTEEEKLNRQRKDFVANVSHELRTPLTTIKSYLEALKDGAVNEPEIATHFLEVAETEAERMARLISDLLKLSRLDAGESYFDPQTTDLSQLLNRVIDRFSIPCQQKQIQLQLKLVEPLSPVFVDNDKIDQVLDNVISNAVKYTPAEGSITITAETNGMAKISIADTGQGIPKQDLSRIFERFYRVDKARSRGLGGTGLGLSIAQEIIHAHGGEIWIESEYNHGTTVLFTLPTTKEVV